MIKKKQELDGMESGAKAEENNEQETLNYYN